MREQEPIEIYKGFYILNNLSSEAAVEKLVQAGIKRVVFFGGMPQMQIAQNEENWLKRRGIKLVLVPLSDNYFNEVKAVNAVLEKIGNPSKKPVLLHCFAGGSTQFIATAYLISRGTTYSMAANKVNAAVTSAGISFIKMDLNEMKVLLQLETHYQELFANRFRRRGFVALAGKRIVRVQKTRPPHRLRK